MTLKVKIFLFYIVIISLFVLDRLLKNFFIKNPAEKQDFLFSILRLTKNNGIAFGIPFNNLILHAIIFIFVIALFLLFFNLKDIYVRTTLFLIFLAALSNFIDRIAYGGVIDYIEILNVISLNIADIMITAGFAVTIFFYIFDKKQRFLIRYNRRNF